MLDTKSLMAIAELCTKAATDAIAPMKDRLAEMEKTINIQAKTIEDLSRQPGPQGVPGPQGEKGDTGDSGDTPDISDLVEEGIVRIERSVMDQLPKLIPDPIKGEKGDTGPQGERGLEGERGPDGIGEPGVKGDKGDKGNDGADGKDAILDQDWIKKQIADSIPDAPLPLAPTDLQVIEAVKAVYPSIRHDLVKRLPAMQHKGVWKPEDQYDVGDEVVKNGSTYRLMEPSTDQPPNEAWQLISQGKLGKKGVPGERGAPGEPGAPGKDGVSVKDLTIQDTTLVQELSNGEVLTLDLSEFVETIIKSMGE